jgi:sarcosine oxidase subunit delta
MKIMPCPLNGPRNITEFACFGEVTGMPEPNAADDAAWAAHVWYANNTAGLVREWWCHTPTNYWFIAERHTVTDEIVRTYPASEVFHSRVDFAPKDGGA